MKPIPSVVQEKPETTKHLELTKKGCSPSSKASRVPRKARTDEPMLKGSDGEEAGRSSLSRPGDAAILAQPLHQVHPPTPLAGARASSPIESLLVLLSPLQPESDEEEEVSIDSSIAEQVPSKSVDLSPHVVEKETATSS